MVVFAFEGRSVSKVAREPKYYRRLFDSRLTEYIENDSQRLAHPQPLDYSPSLIHFGFSQCVQYSHGALPFSEEFDANLTLVILIHLPFPAMSKLSFLPLRLRSYIVLLAE